MLASVPYFVSPVAGRATCKAVEGKIQGSVSPARHVVQVTICSSRVLTTQAIFSATLYALLATLGSSATGKEITGVSTVLRAPTVIRMRRLRARLAGPALTLILYSLNPASPARTIRTSRIPVLAAAYRVLRARLGTTESGVAG